MGKKTGLGKGLDALFSMPVAEEEQQKDGDVLENLKIIDVEPNRNQARKTFDQDSLEELAESIKTYGVIQPIVVTEKDGYYSIIAGERRWRAAKIAGLTEIPAIIRADRDEKKNKEISLIENIQREDLNPIDKAEGIKSLMEEYSLTQEEIGKILGKARSSVANSIRILNLSPEVKELVKQGKISEGHARQLLLITNPKQQYKAAMKLIESNGTVRDIERTIKKKKRIEVDPRVAAVYKDVENTFQGFFGTKVSIDAGVNTGKIIIKYNDNSELERFLDLIK